MGFREGTLPQRGEAGYQGLPVKDEGSLLKMKSILKAGKEHREGPQGFSDLGLMLEQRLRVVAQQLWVLRALLNINPLKTVGLTSTYSCEDWI